MENKGVFHYPPKKVKLFAGGSRAIKKKTAKSMPPCQQNGSQPTGLPQGPQNPNGIVQEAVDLGVGQHQWYHFGVGAPPILVYFSGDWDVHWILTHGHLGVGEWTAEFGGDSCPTTWRWLPINTLSLPVFEGVIWGPIHLFSRIDGTWNRSQKFLCLVYRGVSVQGGLDLFGIRTPGSWL